MTQSSTGRPSPPYSSGTPMPSTPIAARSLMFSCGKVPSCHFVTRGLNFSCASARTEETMARCSSVNSNFILDSSFGKHGRAPLREGPQALGVIGRRENLGERRALGQQAVAEGLLHSGAHHALERAQAARRT